MCVDRGQIFLDWTNSFCFCSPLKTFRAHDRSHPDSEKIYAELDRLTEELKENGYRPDGSWITRPLMNDESEETVLCGHSERLAIAFNLIQKPNRSRIQIVKNLRVCGDCRKWNFSSDFQFDRILMIFRWGNQINSEDSSMLDRGSWRQ